MVTEEPPALSPPIGKDVKAAPFSVTLPLATAEILTDPVSTPQQSALVSVPVPASAPAPLPALVVASSLSTDSPVLVSDGVPPLGAVLTDVISTAGPNLVAVPDSVPPVLPSPPHVDSNTTTDPYFAATLKEATARVGYSEVTPAAFADVSQVEHSVLVCELTSQCYCSRRDALTFHDFKELGRDMAVGVEQLPLYLLASADAR